MGKISAFLLLLGLAAEGWGQAALRMTGLDFRLLGGQQMNSNFAMAGGMGNAQFSATDLDGDGQLDLVAFDRAGGVWLPFENISTASGSAAYAFRADWQRRFPSVENWALVRDFNCDGVGDIFCNYRRPASGYIGIGVFLGQRLGDGSVVYTLERDILFYPDPNNTAQMLNIFVSNIDIPAVDDIDGDGDLDILTFNASGGYLELYRNRSQEEGYGCDSLIYVLGDNCWGRFYESGVTEQISLSPNIDSCAYYANWQPVQRNPRHAGSTVATLDMDNDGDKELFLGDISFTNITMLRNGGSNALAFVDSQQIFFPQAAPVDLDAYPAAYFVDFNNDGKLDMLATPSADDYSQNVQCVLAYSNIGSNAAPRFNLESSDFLVGQMIDLGGTSAPAFVDIDADGDKDLIVASNGTFVSPSVFRRSLYLYRNIGTAAAPIFELVDTDFARLAQFNFERMVPTFGDLDADGDQDLLLGTLDGTLIYVQNTGTASAPVFAQPRINYEAIDIGNYSAPALFDLDEDGDLDLVVGERNGNLNYFENTGTSAIADFPAVPNSATFGLIDTRVNGVEGNSAPHFIVHDGEWILIIGTEDGGLRWYQNIRNNLSGAFTAYNHLAAVDEGRQSIAAAADINNDGLLDIFVGNKRGGLAAYTFDPNAVGAQIIAPLSQPDLRIYPNPARQYVVLAGKGKAALRLYNAQGQLVRDYGMQIIDNQLNIDLPELAAGLYFVQFGGQTLPVIVE